MMSVLIPKELPNQRLLARGQSQKRWITDSNPTLQREYKGSKRRLNLARESLVGRRLEAILYKCILSLLCKPNFQILPLVELFVTGENE